MAIKKYPSGQTVAELDAEIDSGYELVSSNNFNFVPPNGLQGLTSIQITNLNYDELVITLSGVSGSAANTLGVRVNPYSYDRSDSINPDEYSSFGLADGSFQSGGSAITSGIYTGSIADTSTGSGVIRIFGCNSTLPKYWEMTFGSFNVSATGTVRSGIIDRKEKVTTLMFFLVSGTFDAGKYEVWGKK